MKKLIIALICIALAFMLASCSGSNNDEPQEANATTQPASTTEPTGRIYYDRLGNEFESLEEMPFYDENGNKYYLVNQIDQVFADEQGSKLDGNHCFVDTHGIFVFDKDESIVLDDSLSAKGKDGRTYYPAATVRWTSDGAMINAFGLGQEVVPD